jgi:hypothetical protein
MQREEAMNHKLKFLGLALAAIFATSAIGASAASATVEFHSESAPVTMTGAQEGTSNAFDVQFGEVKCTTAKYTATTAATTQTTIQVTPSYSGCTFAGVASTVDMNGCTYMIHVFNEGPPYEAWADIVCPAGGFITVTGGTKCNVFIPAQTGLEFITITNIGSGSTRELTLGLGGLQEVTYVQSAGTGVGKCTSVGKADGKYTGTATVTGEVDPGTTHVGLFVA